MLAAYVHSRGGGQQAAPAAEPATDVAQAPKAETDG
jgi:cytochrome c oxidase cbb3-type subunit 3